MTIAEILALPSSPNPRQIRASDTGLLYTIAAGASGATATADVTVGGISAALSTASDSEKATVRANMGAPGSVNTQAGTSYSALVSDYGKVLRFTSSGAISLTLPNTVSSPFYLLVEIAGDGIVTIGAAAGYTVSGITSVEEGTVCIYLDGTTYRVLASGENTDAANLGTGAGLFKEKVGTELRFNSIGVVGGRIINDADRLDIMMDSMLHASTIEYLNSTAIDTAASVYALDNLFRMLAGQASSSSLNGATWSTLSGDLLTSMVCGHIFKSNLNKGSGATLFDLKGSYDGTVNGALSWSSAGFAFSGVSSEYVQVPQPITTGEWSFIGGGINSAVGGTAETFFSANNSSSNRTTLLYYETTGHAAVFRNDGTSHLASSGASEGSASQRLFMSRQTATDLEIYKDGSTSAAGTAASTPGAFPTTSFRYGQTPIATGFFSGTIILGMLWNSAILPADYNKIRDNLNSILGTSFA